MADFEQILRDMSNENTARTFAFNSSEAEKTRNWQESMSNTSHQREVDDLKRAGLNPVLSANGGAQAYSGASASGSADSSSVGALASLYQTKMNNDNAMQIAKMNNETSLKMAKISAAASNYSSQMSSGAMKYSADMSSSASRYSTEHTKQGALTEFINGVTGSETGARDLGKKAGSFLKKVGKIVKQSVR